jgi:hypothetical protein
MGHGFRFLLPLFSCKKHWGFPTKVSDMARNMKMELHTFSLILYQSKKCGHRIHVLFMMYDVYWYCQMQNAKHLTLNHQTTGPKNKSCCQVRFYFLYTEFWLDNFGVRYSHPEMYGRWPKSYGMVFICPTGAWTIVFLIPLNQTVDSLCDTAYHQTKLDIYVFFYYRHFPANKENTIT